MSLDVLKLAWDCTIILEEGKRRSFVEFRRGKFGGIFIPPLERISAKNASVLRLDNSVLVLLPLRHVASEPVSKEGLLFSPI